MKIHGLIPLLALSLLAFACDRSGEEPKPRETDAKYVGKAVGNFTAEEWYPGGLLGTTLNVADDSYEDEAPAVTEQGLSPAFVHGEMFFERNVTLNTAPFKGLGPAAVRKSCLDCHPGYGHGQWQDAYAANGSRSYGNGYLLVVYHPVEPGSNDGPYVSEVTGMPQTMAADPFLRHGIPVSIQDQTIAFQPQTTQNRRDQTDIIFQKMLHIYIYPIL